VTSQQTPVIGPLNTLAGTLVTLGMSLQSRLPTPTSPLLNIYLEDI
jgi:hypothetical protein